MKRTKKRARKRKKYISKNDNNNNNNKQQKVKIGELLKEIHSIEDEQFLLQGIKTVWH